MTKRRSQIGFSFFYGALQFNFTEGDLLAVMGVDDQKAVFPADHGGVRKFPGLGFQIEYFFKGDAVIQGDKNT
jgi:hypothetical protein